jgi:hypothetical protein
MPASQDVIAAIEMAFARVEHPGDAFIVQSFEGCEPGEIAEAFAGRHDWRQIDAAFLDRHYVALSFLSEGGLRFYLPAYLVADLRRELKTADPVFPLVYQLSEWAVPLEAGGERFDGRHGAGELLNPLRYGAMRNADYARFRLSVFAREEAVAIVAYLEWRAGMDDHDRPHIEAALTAYWRERTASAPTQHAVAAHLAERARYVAALERDRAGRQDGERR